MDDAELFAAARATLFTALVGDTLDRMGLRHQFLGAALRPIDPGMVILGRAMTVTEANVGAGGNSSSFGLLFKALDDLRPGEVYICAGASPNYALWGGLMSVRAVACGAAGAVLHGYHRDTSEILRLGFPVASFGAYAQDQAGRGEVTAWRQPITVDGVAVASGDVVFGDRDGVLIVPRDAVAEAFAGAFEKARGEGDVLRALRGGMTTAQAFAQFGLM